VRIFDLEDVFVLAVTVVVVHYRADVVALMHQDPILGAELRPRYVCQLKMRSPFQGTRETKALALISSCIAGGRIPLAACFMHGRSSAREVPHLLQEGRTGID